MGKSQRESCEKKIDLASLGWAGGAPLLIELEAWLNKDGEAAECVFSVSGDERSLLVKRRHGNALCLLRPGFTFQLFPRDQLFIEPRSGDGEGRITVNPSFQGGMLSFDLSSTGQQMAGSLAAVA